MKILAHWNLEKWFLEMAFPARSANLSELWKFPQAPFFRLDNQYNHLSQLQSKKQRNSVTNLNTHEALALRTVQNREFRVPVRVRKSPKSGKLPFEPASLFCYFLGQCQKVSRKIKVKILVLRISKSEKVSREKMPGLYQQWIAPSTWLTVTVLHHHSFLHRPGMTDYTQTTLAVLT